MVLTHTPAFFRVDGSLQEYPAKSAVLFPPFSPIYYCACGDRYENDWLRFDSDEEYVSSLPVQGIPFSLPDADYCHNLFQLLTWKNAFPGAHNERITGQLLQLLFSELQEASLKIPGSLSSHYHELVNLRKSIYNSPQLPWSVPDMARQLHLSEAICRLSIKTPSAFPVWMTVLTPAYGWQRISCATPEKQLRPSQNSAATTMWSISAASLNGLREKARVRSGHPQKNATRTGFRKGKANLLFHHNSMETSVSSGARSFSSVISRIG